MSRKLLSGNENSAFCGGSCVYLLKTKNGDGGTGYHDSYGHREDGVKYLVTGGTGGKQEMTHLK